MCLKFHDVSQAVSTSWLKKKMLRNTLARRIDFDHLGYISLQFRITYNGKLRGCKAVSNCQNCFKSYLVTTVILL